jgi:hypothetical protein
MKFFAILFTVLAALANAPAQVELVSDNFFPADSEFQELKSASSDESFADAARLSRVTDGSLFSDVGFDKYARRIYPVGESGSLSIEVVTLNDSRAAYSLLTLLRSADIQKGPPGDEFTATTGDLRFANGRRWVRIQGSHVPEDLLKRVATSVSNRINPERKKAPSLISHLPKQGLDGSSLRYFVGAKSFDAYSSASRTGPLKFSSDMEVAQARYSINNQTGILSLVSFPTSQVADDYYLGMNGAASPQVSTSRTYAKKAGPLVAILEGNFDPGAADKILSSVRFSYSIRWIQEKRDVPKTIWGIPAGILGTVVKSLFFVVVLCGVSILAGACFALLRFMLRGYAIKNGIGQPEGNEITRLKLQ